MSQRRTVKQQVADRKKEREENVARARKKRKKALKKKQNDRAIAKRKAAVDAVTAPEAKAAKKKRTEKKRILTQETMAQQELARRELARRHLLPFIHRFMPSYKAGWFHKDLCRRLEKFLDDVVAEKSPRLMLFVPPRGGKSITVSDNFPSWSLGKYPHLEFICASYAETLQTDFSKQIQEKVRSPEYQVLFPGLTIPRKHEAVSRWKLARDGRLTGGGLLAAGVGGPLTGRGAHIGLIDDPVKNAEEADSETIRQSIKNWYSSTFYTRLAPGGGVLIVQTRWHDDDLSGWLLREMAKALLEEQETGVWPEDADQWEVVSYPAIAVEDEKYRKKGEALHPERFDLKQLLKIKRTLLPRHWSALYQQNPVAEDGMYFTKQMLRFYRPQDMPRMQDLDIYCAGDLAISTKEHADYTVFVIVGLDKDDNIWVLDVRRNRWDTDGIIDEIVDIYKTWEPLEFGIEREKIAIAIGPMLRKRILKDRLYGLRTVDLHIAGRDKRARARPIQGRFGLGQVKMPEDASWKDHCVNELLRFDKGVYDDFVDAIAWIGQMLKDVVHRGRQSGKKKKKSWKEKLKSYARGTGPGSHMGA